MRRPALALAIAAAAFLGACSPRTETPPSDDALPEVNEANCRPEAIKALPKRIREDFASRCFRSGTFSPSPPRHW
ncbi:entry exclusion lipoprotein TrbK [Azohydromonas caseinilytica]|uniref:Entry exclusion lipoprotein TrbK n=1 Tax=Azohydromonas caseinilytica TaxID=2728836 RepID=A0A848FDW9_9BURK|nr:entry exclusion lipoprotein TrbK [Azohydromonas caseinilytica]NML17015.1 entry exclusion lipoprotein TrbK [Azohydromonas caseinilytica]